MTIRSICLALVMSAAQISVAEAQSRKPTRSAAPEFKPGQFEGIFFADVTSVLKGNLPERQAAVANASLPTNTHQSIGPQVADGDPLAWHNLISPNALEDLIKGSKLRLDQLITTPAAFAGGGFLEARKEFSLQALLFAIIEAYPNNVRWKSSSSVAREAFARAAANTKVGSRQVYDEAKKRLGDLSELMNGSQLPGESRSEVEWSMLIDRVPLMQLLEWSEKEHVSTFTASESQFQEHSEELQRFAELIAVLGKASIQRDMPDADDDDYRKLAVEMIAQAQQVIQAVETKNADAARLAVGRLGQSCTNCHDNFR